MVVNANFLKLYSMMGNYRNLLSSRLFLPTYQPIATLKQTVEEKLGLPLKPKRPKTQYFKFVDQLRPIIREKNPDLKWTELTKIIAEEWHKTDDKVKSKLNDEYKVELEAYFKAKAEYDKNITKDQKERLEIFKTAAKRAKEQKTNQQVLKTLGRPKRPAAAFQQWTASLGLKRGARSLGDWQKELLQRWETLPQQDKEFFETKAAKEMTEYRHLLKDWKEKMVESGNYDLITYGAQLNKKPEINPKSTE